MSGCYGVETDDGGMEFHLWSELGSFDGADRTMGSERFRYLDIIGGNVIDRENGHSTIVMAAFGNRTDSARMPSGTAAYFGDMNSRSQLADNSNRSGRRDFRGRLLLTADFGGSTLDGRLGELRVRRYDEQGNRAPWEDLPGSNRFAIENGAITGGQFTAAVTGMDPDANPLDDTVAGFQGSVRGEFYGPAADELGAVFSAESTDHNRVLLGNIRGKRLNPRVPAGELSTVSAAIIGDFDASSTQLTDAAAITAVESDGAGGFHVTYRLDGADERVHLDVGDFGHDRDAVSGVTDFFEQRTGNRSHGFWDAAGSFWSRTNVFFGNPEFDYFNVNGWFVINWLDADNAENAPAGFVVYGTPTDAGDLPAVTASYAGKVQAERQPTSTVSRSDMTRLRADFSLTANFAASTIGGMINNLEDRGPGESGYSPLPGSIDLQNGAITGSQFNAELVGQQDLAGVDGNMKGQFFGPGAAEVGGVISGTDSVENAVLTGWFGGTKQ